MPRLTIVPQVTAIGGFHDFLINDQGFGTGIGVARGGAVLNVSANYQLTEQVALYATGYNLTRRELRSRQRLRPAGHVGAGGDAGEVLRRRRRFRVSA